MSTTGGNPGTPTFTEEKIRDILAEASGGVKVVDLAARYRIPEVLIRGWQSRYEASSPASRPSRDPGPDSDPYESPLTILKEGSGPQGALAAAHARVGLLEEENARLRRIVGDLVLENRALKEGGA